MNKLTISCNNESKTVAFNDGESLLDVLATEGAVIRACCGGLGKCGKCKVIVDGKEVLACQCKAEKGQNVLVNSSFALHEDESIVKSNGLKDCDIVIDIGTTTVNAMAVNGEGVAQSVYNSVNPQLSYGADVIARIAASNEGKLGEMQSCIVSVIDKIISKFQLANCLKEDYKIYIAGNTVMLHILFLQDCKSLGLAPYTPVFLEMQKTSARNLGIDSNAELITFPGISTYVGADIVAGIYSVGMPNKGKYNILLDLGTNAEIAIFSDTNIYVTAAAAGPCFEGAGISCGMSATSGAICSAEILGGDIAVKTIGNTEPCGICGTGLLDIISIMKSLEIFDEYGTFESDDDFRIFSKISLNQQDIRQFQLAKSAIFSAVKVMLKKLNISYDEIENLFISGGFSAKMNVDNAVNVGLVDAQLKDKCKAVKNSCISGLVKYLVSGGDLVKITESSIYVDMSNDIEFANEFVENMNF